ncbi:MAG TPA: DOMON-like domain-containing protein [Rhizomicrobium sp.]
MLYVVTGDIGAFRLPAIREQGRADGLWRQTCFEAFLRPQAREEYYEFNFAPSLQWAAYGFSGYRSGMRAAEEFGGLRIEIESDASRLELRVALSLSELPDLLPDAPWRLGLSAIIEEATGAMSYWALAHPAGKPDFHHPDCFALELPPALRA